MFSCEHCETLKNTILKNICERLLLILWRRIEITQAKKIKINWNICRSSRPEVFYKKVFLKISQNSQENTCTRASFLIKLQAPAAGCFSVWGFNFVNWHDYKEEFKEIAYKSKQMTDGKLSRLAGTKFNFHM